jgi:hypothetical protein
MSGPPASQDYCDKPDSTYLLHCIYIQLYNLTVVERINHAKMGWSFHGKNVSTVDHSKARELTLYREMCMSPQAE